MWYNIDLYKFSQHLLPPMLRKKRLFAFLSILILPFVYLVSLFLKFRIQSLNKLNTNGQVIYIEKVLNDRFFLKNKEIYITDIFNKNVYAYYRSEEQIPLYFYKRSEGSEVKYIPLRDEGSINGNFMVNIPSFLSDYESDIKTLVDYYKPAGRSYVLKIYEYE